jgi:hypothetical protein
LNPEREKLFRSYPNNDSTTVQRATEMPNEAG